MYLDCSVFNDAISNSGYTVSQDDCEWELERMLMEVVMSYFWGTVLAFVWRDRGKLRENLCQKCLCPNWGSIWAPPEYKAETFQLEPVCQSRHLLHLSEYPTQFVIHLIVEYKTNKWNTFCVWSFIHFLHLPSGP